MRLTALRGDVCLLLAFLYPGERWKQQPDPLTSLCISLSRDLISSPIWTWQKGSGPETSLCEMAALHAGSLINQAKEHTSFTDSVSDFTVNIHAHIRLDIGKMISKGVKTLGEGQK